MRLFTIASLASLIALTPAAAQAVDLLTVPTSGNDSLPVADSGFDWNGFYAGVYGVGQGSAVGGGQYGLGVDLGVNARLEFVLVGGEVAIQGLGGGAGGTAYIEGIGKAGLALSDDIVAYAAGGLGASLAGPVESDLLVGGGVDFAVSNDVSIGARYLHGFAVTGGNPKDQFTVGASFHF